MQYEPQLEVAVNAAMNQIRNLSYGELKDLHENEAKIDAIIEALPQIRALPNEKDMVLAQNKSYAECNLALEPKLNEAKAELMENYRKALEYKSQVEALKSQLDEVSSKRSIDSTCACLQAAVREAEDESEKLMEDLQQGKLEPEKFVEEYVKKRTLAHKRKIKSEKLLAIVNEQQMVMDRRASTKSVPYPDATPGPLYPNPRHSNYY
uniref:VPS37 C-terminal domain-containing protein n=1 Tax=Steinernema glaseri TaxID=37863 RepID=A0A1I8ARW0_9BILA